MKEESETLAVNAGLETEELLNFVFRSLSDPEVDEVELTD
jgi:hypothetical protein